MILSLSGIIILYSAQLTTVPPPRDVVFAPDDDDDDDETGPVDDHCRVVSLDGRRTRTHRAAAAERVNAGRTDSHCTAAVGVLYYYFLFGHRRRRRCRRTGRFKVSASAGRATRTADRTTVAADRAGREARALSPRQCTCNRGVRRSSGATTTTTKMCDGIERATTT